MNLNHLINAYDMAQRVCPPDEYAVRQRQLMYAMVEYIIEKEKKEGTYDSSDVSGRGRVSNAGRPADEGCNAGSCPSS